MKKLFLSLSVVFLFMLYSIQQKMEAQQVTVVPPKFTTGQTSQTQNMNGMGMGGPPAAKGPMMAGNIYKDGTFTGSVEDAFYGNVQVQATIQNGKIIDVQFLQYPNDRGTSIMINGQAMPYLKSEAIQAQNAQVNIVSGATDTSQAFIASLTNALAQAKN